MLNGAVAAALEHVERSAYVAQHIGGRVLQRVAHARLRREVHDTLEALAGEERRNSRRVREIQLHEAERSVPGEAREPRLLELHVVVIVEVIEADDFLPLIEEPLRGGRADKAGSPGHQDLHNRPSVSAAGNKCLTSYSTRGRRHRRLTPGVPRWRNSP